MGCCPRLFCCPLARSGRLFACARGAPRRLRSLSTVVSFARSLAPSFPLRSLPCSAPVRRACALARVPRWLDLLGTLSLILEVKPFFSESLEASWGYRTPEPELPTAQLNADRREGGEPRVRERAQSVVRARRRARASGTDRQTRRQTDRWTRGQTGSQTRRHAGGHAGTQTDGQARRQAASQASVLVSIGPGLSSIRIGSGALALRLAATALATRAIKHPSTHTFTSLVPTRPSAATNAADLHPSTDYPIWVYV